MKNRIVKALLPVLLSFVMGISLTPVSAYALTHSDTEGEKITLTEPGEDWEKISITTAEELVDLSNRCRLDSASDNLYVKLENDISMTGVEFEPIPYFAGIFDGGNFTISGLSCKNTTEPIGLFGTIGIGALVKNVKVIGTLQPKDNCNYIGGIAGKNSGVIYNATFSGVVTGNNYVGGIAGINTLTGTIVAGTSYGAVRGDNMTGGIAGTNNGTIIGCKNYALINTESVEGGVNVNNLDLEFTLDLSKFTSQSANSGTQDMGGIAGYSSGTIFNCENEGEIGYNHIGYNLGGIVGRNCGYVLSSTNKAHITGRKDVGGIVGQMEPYIKKTVSESQLYILNSQLEEMQSLMQKTQEDASAYSAELGNRVSNVTDSVSNAQNSASELSDSYFEGEKNINSDSANEAAEDAKNYIKDIAEGNVSRDDIESDAKEKTENVKNKEKTEKEQGLYDSLTELNAQIELLNKEAQNCNKTLDADLQAINEQYDAIQETISNFTISEVKDTSLEDPDLITLGAVRNCVNEGFVEGDLNAGGIAGVMGEESSVDPEEEISLHIDTETQTQYEYKVILDACKNKGEVYTKRNYVGGIVARAEIGYVRRSESYGKVSSDGNYVGGIAATTQITIKDCYVKATLSGNKYVGGIIAEGVTQNVDGAGSMVSDCRALVNIENATKFYGAIAASDAGAFDNNIFVSEVLTGIGGVSKNGKAYPVSYEALIAGDNTPKDFSTLTLTFVVDDTILKAETFSYGDSFDEAVFPDLPRKQGYYAKWDITDLSNLTMDTTVSAVYTTYIAGLTSEAQRASERAVFYVEGDFSDEHALVVLPLTNNLYQVETENTNALHGIFFSRELEEQWKVVIPKDGREVHTLRYLPSDISVREPEIYVHEDNVWVKANPTVLGSYYAFDISSENIEVAVVTTTPVYAAWVLAITGVVVIIVLVVFIITKVHAAKKKKALKALETVTEKEDLESLLDEAAPRDGEENSEDNKYLSGWEEGNSHKEKKSKKQIFLLVARTFNLLLFVAIVSLTVFFTLHPEYLRTRVAHLLVETVALDKNAEFDVKASIEARGTEKQINANIWKKETDYGIVTTVNTNGTNLYLNGTRLYLENGKAFETSEIVPDYGNVFDVILPEISNCKIESKKVDGGRKYTATLSGEAAENVLYAVLGEYSIGISRTDDVSVILSSKNFTVKGVEIKGNAYSNEYGRISVDCVINVVPKDERTEKEIPKEVLTAVAENGAAAVITTDMVDLLYAFGDLYSKDPTVCDIKLSASGKVITLSDTLSWYRTKVKDEWVSCVSKNGVDLYYNKNGACTAKGVSLTENQQSTVDAAGLLDFAYDICLKSRYSVSEEDEITSYRIGLKEEDIKTLMELVAPELNDMDISAGNGNILVDIKDGEIQNIGLQISGKAKLVHVTKNFTVSANIIPVSPNANANYEIPAEVINTLMGK